MRAVIVAGILAVLAFALGVACLDQRAACAQEEPIVDNIPWSDSERAEYILLDHGDPEIECGTGTLTVERVGDEFELTLRFEDEENSDTSVVTVDDETLRPSFVSRERVFGDDEEGVTGEYDPVNEEIRILEYSSSDDEDPRSVPRRLDEAVYYDNEASIFLWRTIPFEEDLILEYKTVLVNQGGAQRDVTLRVVGLETVDVPAGTFEAWRVDINTEDVNQVAFFANTPERPLIFYDNSVQVFQLTSYEP